MSDPTGLRELAADARAFQHRLVQRIHAGDIDTSTDVTVIAFDTREVMSFSVMLIQLWAAADELALRIEQGPSREELLDAATAAGMAADQAREANDRLERIMGRLWFKAPPPVDTSAAIYHEPESAA